MNFSNRILGEIGRGRTLSNLLHLSLNQGINVLTALIITPILYQRLGESAFGTVNLALSVVLLMAVFVGSGFNINAPRQIALIKTKNEEVSSYISEVIQTRLLLAVFTGSIVLASIFWLDVFPSYQNILALSLIYLFAEALLPITILQGYDRMLLVAIGNALIKVSYLVGIILLVNGPKDAQWVNFIFGGASFVINGSILLYTFHIRSIKFKWKSLERLKVRFYENFHFLLSTIASYVLINGGFIILSNFVSDDELGQYALAHRVVLLLRVIPVFIAQSILQQASRLYEDDRTQYKRYLHGSVKQGLVLTLLLAGVFLIIADWVVLILSGESIPYSANLLRVVCFIPFLAMLNIRNTVEMIVMNFKKEMSSSLWISTFGMIIFSVIGSAFFGGFGLAVALVFGELFTFIIHSILLRRDKAKLGT